jgi:hypothetical protein
MSARRPVSRVLSPLARGMTIHLGRSSPSASRDRPGWRRGNPPDPLPGRPGRVCHPYLVLLPVGFTLPSPLPATRCALTAPFHPCRPRSQERNPGLGGLLSVALSLRSPSPGVTRHRISVEPGLSSPRPRIAPGRKAVIRPSGTALYRAAGPACQIAEAPAALARMAMRRAVSASSPPSQLPGRQCRWKAAITAVVMVSSRPLCRVS